MTALTQAPLATSHSPTPVTHTPVRIWEICLCLCVYLCVGLRECVMCVSIGVLTVCIHIGACYATAWVCICCMCVIGSGGGMHSHTMCE